MDRISELPKEILQRILYFLSQKEAVRTSVLSKSWRYIWSTRPNLDFSYAPNSFRQEEFISTVDKNLQLYHDRRVCLEEFHLRTLLGYRVCDYKWVSLLEKWIPLLTTMGVKDFRLSIRPYTGFIDLPSVVFQSESLKHLHVEKCILDQKTTDRIVLCKNLKALSLEEVDIHDDFLQKIISSCPLIETLHVERYKGLRTIKMNNLHHLKDFSLDQPLSEELCSIEIYPPSLETVNMCDSNIWFNKGANFLNLNKFYLSGMKSSLDHFSSSKFPSLRHLTLLGCDGLKEIKLFIDAPNIRIFEFSGTFVPSISFAKTSNEWESRIGVGLQEGSLCLLKLNELLRSLSQSKISLGISHDDIIQENILGEIQDNGSTKPVVVDSLGLRCPSSSYSSLLNAALCICRPRKIVYSLRTKMIEFVALMWKILMERESGNKDPLTQLLFRDLEEASLELKGYSYPKGWHPAPLSEYLLNYKQCDCRFVMKWRENL